MSGFRYSLGAMMALVVCLALALIALRTASSFWASVEFTTALAVLLVAGLGIGYRRGVQRAFWVGAAGFASAYFLCAFGPWFQMEVQPHLVTTRIFSELYPRFHPPPLPASRTATGFDMDLYSFHYRPYDAELLWHRHLANFLRTGHAICVQALALVGGILAAWFYRSNDREANPQPALVGMEAVSGPSP